MNRAPIEDVKAEAEPLINRAMQINPNLPEVLAVKGWLLNEEFRSDEALPLLLRATTLTLPAVAVSDELLPTVAWLSIST